MKTLNRREFLMAAGGGLAAVAVGSKMMPWLLKNPAYAAVQTQTLDFHITDAMKDMVTHNPTNDARCYFWIYKSVAPDLPAECPGPNIFATKGDTIQIRLTNDLDEPHAFSIPGMFDSGPLAPGQTIEKSFTASRAGAHMYFDNLNSPVSRMMGLHGAFIVMPDAPVTGHKFTPYDKPTPGVQKLFDDFGSSAHYPGLAWEEGDPATGTPPFRTYIWLLHQASPNLFAEVGKLPAGQLYPPQQFMDAFLNDPFSRNNSNRMAQYFTVNGQSGAFSHETPFITPHLRVGEPCVLHMMNAGLWTHSMHLHANHFYVTFLDGEVQENPLWLDTWNVLPMELVDYIVPFMRPPDCPNVRGIGMPDTPLVSLNGHPIWPPIEELNTFLPPLGAMAGNIPIHVQLSPLCYPMHDHSEPTQTAQGGNYNNGMIAGMYITGDRNTPGGVTTFPNPPHQSPPNATGPAAPPFGH